MASNDIDDSLNFSIKINETNDKQQQGLIDEKKEQELIKKYNNYSNLNSEDDDISTRDTQISSNSQLSIPIQQNISNQPNTFLNTIQSSLEQSSHPIACIFTCLFKILAILSYLFLGIFTSSFIFNTIFVIIFCAADFWVVKNVSGRLLVGLRWWSEFQQDGSEVWRYEGYDDKREPNQIDSNIFWGSQGICLLIWGLFLLGNILRPYWFMVDGFAIGMIFTNLYSFYKCRGEHQKKISSMRESLQNTGLNIFGKFIMNRALGSGGNQ